jgi:MFS family permease
MTRELEPDRNETTPLLSYRERGDGERRWSIARRRSSAFLSFLSEPDDKDGDEFQEYHRKRAIYLMVFISTVYNIGVGIYNSFAVELIQTLACAEYYHVSSPSAPDATFPTLPTAGDPLEICSVPWVDKRTSQMATYSDTLSSISGCIASLVLAKQVLPRFSRRAAFIASILVSLITCSLLAMLPTHYSFDSSVPSSSTVHPTVAMHLFIALCFVGGLFGAFQTALSLLGQVMMLDVCKEDEKTAAFAKTFASITLGMAIASVVIRLVLPAFHLNFSILHHTGPFSPFWICVGVWLIALAIATLFLPETKRLAPVHRRSRRGSDASTATDTSVSHIQTASPLTTQPSASPSLARRVVADVQETLGLFGYLVPYKPGPGAKRDYKLPLMMCALVFCDTITLIWSNLVVFCSTHLHFGPPEVTTLLGLLGATKGLYSLFALPWIVKMVHRAVKRRMRDEIVAASIEELPSEVRIAKREQSVIFTDQIVAMASLSCDCLGFVAMGVAASHLSVPGIYGSKSDTASLTRLREQN